MILTREIIMIYTTAMLIDIYGKEYSNPKTKIRRLVKEGKYTPIIRGLYETDPNLDGKLLADIIYNPSYLSFEYALSFHSLIPEGVEAYTSATVGKNRSKCYLTPFGRYTYRDVPESVFGTGIRYHIVGEYTFWMAVPEKALCDMLYKLPRITSLKAMECTLLDDMRIYEDGLDDMNLDTIRKISDRYRNGNVSVFQRYMEKRCRA